jgi:hypothetical protein
MALGAREHVASPRLTLGSGARYRGQMLLSLTAWWQAAELDRQLAAGVSPATSATLALRAHRITAPRSRRRLAAGLARLLPRAQDRMAGFSAAVRPCPGEVVAARAALVALDRRLRDPQPVAARGAAMLQTLLTDGTSPLYRPAAPGALGGHLHAAAAALEPPPDEVHRASPPEIKHAPASDEAPA